MCCGAAFAVLQEVTADGASGGWLNSMGDRDVAPQISSACGRRRKRCGRLPHMSTAESVVRVRMPCSAIRRGATCSVGASGRPSGRRRMSPPCQNLLETHHLSRNALRRETPSGGTRRNVWKWEREARSVETGVRFEPLLCNMRQCAFGGADDDVDMLRRAALGSSRCAHFETPHTFASSIFAKAAHVCNRPTAVSVPHSSKMQHKFASGSVRTFEVLTMSHSDGNISLGDARCCVPTSYLKVLGLDWIVTASP